MNNINHIGTIRYLLEKLKNYDTKEVYLFFPLSINIITEELMAMVTLNYNLVMITEKGIIFFMKLTEHQLLDITSAKEASKPGCFPKQIHKAQFAYLDSVNFNVSNCCGW
jgi:hypothetical protein